MRRSEWWAMPDSFSFGILTMGRRRKANRPQWNTPEYINKQLHLHFIILDKGRLHVRDTPSHMGFENNGFQTSIRIKSNMTPLQQSANAANRSVAAANLNGPCAFDSKLENEIW